MDVALIRDLITIGTALVIAYVAIKGLNTWRNQLQGSARYDAASRLMIACRRFQPAFKAARSPAIWAWEGANRPKEPNEPEDETPIRDHWVIHHRRLEPLFKVIDELQETRWTAGVMLGDEARLQVETHTSRLVREANLLNVSINEYFNSSLQYLHREIPEAVNTIMEIHRRRLYDQSGEAEPDPPQQSVDTAVEALADVLREFLK